MHQSKITQQVQFCATLQHSGVTTFEGVKNCQVQHSNLIKNKEYLANCTNHSVSLRLLYRAMYAYQFYVTQLDVLPAHIATFFGLREIMLHLSSTVLNLDTEDVHARTPLSWAAWRGHEAVVKVLIEKGGVVDSVDTDGQTPLLWAAEKGHEAVVKMLIEKGAAVDLVDTNGQTLVS